MIALDASIPLLLATFGKLLQEPIISVSGLRVVVGESLSPELALRFATAFAASLAPGPIVLSQDGRTTGPMFADAIRATIVALGRDCLDAGVAATPTVGVLVRTLNAAGGIQISASHNPPQYNGIKLFGPDGRVLTAEVGKKVERRYRELSAASGADVRWATHDKIGLAQHNIDSASEHLRLVLSIVDVPRIRAKKFRVLPDANHGSGSVLGRRLLESLGCQATMVGGEPDGRFEHPAEPTAENLAGLISQVKGAKVDVAFCQDPDADRLAIIDNAGRYIGEECTLALCVDHVLRTRRGPVVINLSTSRMTEDIAARYEVPVFRSAVGEANVVDRMLAEGAVLGGEGNGGVIDPRVVLVRDSLSGMALVLDAMAAREVRLDQLADELPKYAMLKTKIELAPEKAAAAFAALEQHFSDASKSHEDGLRLAWPSAWLHVRKSNTEPIVRAIAEAPTEEESQRLCREAAQVMAGV